MSARSTILLLTFVLAVPTALGGWAALGNHEPSSRHDVEDGYAYTSADTAASGDRVYFNGFIAVANQGTDLGSLSPNLGTIQTSMNPMSYEARLLFGVWKDCNHDGFVGLGDQGLFEYRAEILNGDAAALATCPPRPTAPTNLASWHNDGLWVREYVPIGWSQGGLATPPTLSDVALVDNGSRAWYDNGYPEEKPLNSCVLGPQLGTLHSTGGLLFNLDCMDQFHATAAYDGVADVVDAKAGTHLSFSDAPQNQYASRSTLNLYNPWGNPSDPSYVDAWSCGSGQTSVTRVSNGQTDVAQGGKQVNATNGDGWLAPGVSGVANVAPVYANASALAPAPGLHAPPPRPYAPGDASASGTVNGTGSGFDQCARRDDGAGRQDAVARDPYVAEGSGSQSSGGHGKQVSQQVMFPDWRDAQSLNRARDAKLSVQGQPVDAGAALSGAVGPRAPLNLGTHVVSNDGLWRGGIWASKFASRNYTFYGLVSQGAVDAYGLTLRHPETSPYYGEVCASGDLGVSATGVDCNPADWWKDPATGVDLAPRSPFLGKDQDATEGCAGAGAAGATYSSTTSSPPASSTRGCVSIASRVGDPFNLRDVDCIDDGAGPARFAGVHAHPQEPVNTDGTVFYDQCEPVG